MRYRIAIGPRSFEMDATPVTIARFDEGGNRQSLNRSGEFVHAEIGQFTEPSFALNPEDAQILANQLWEAGIRPSQAGRSVGQIEAQSGHLEDMRAIAFAKLGIDKP